MAPDILSITIQNLFSFLNIFGNDILRSTIALFVVINPIGTIPLFRALLKKCKKKKPTQY